GTISDPPSGDQTGPNATAYVALVAKSATTRSPVPSVQTTSTAAESRTNVTVRPSGENVGDSSGFGPTARRSTPDPSTATDSMANLTDPACAPLVSSSAASVATRI